MFNQDRGAIAPLPRGLAVSPAQPSDRRADGEARSVSLSRDIVRIDRRVRGIAMRVAVPVRAYRGVALMLSPGWNDTLFYRLQLVHDDADLTIWLDEAADDSEILADWRLWTRFFGLPALVERTSGAIELAEPSLGALQLGGSACNRRASSVPSKRRPRFLRRRKMGVVSADPVIHAEDREIIARS